MLESMLAHALSPPSYGFRQLSIFVPGSWDFEGDWTALSLIPGYAVDRKVILHLPGTHRMEQYSFLEGIMISIGTNSDNIIVN